MDMRQLRYFLAVAQEGQVTGAAKRLHMEQPPLSRQLKLMEQELGVTLFDRSGKRLQLTPAGELLRARAELLLRQFEESLKEVQAIDEGVQGVLAVGAVVSCISLLPETLRRFREMYPLVTYKIREGDHFLLGELLDRREIELVVARLPFEAPGGSGRYAVKPLPSDPFVALVPSAWELRADEFGLLDLRALSERPLITLKTDRTVAMHESVVRTFTAAGLTPRILCECSSVAITLALVAAGLGAALLPKSVLTSFPLTGIAMFELAGGGFQSDVGVVWLKDRYLSRRAMRFIDLF
ncbi:LysR family transcriptional regulator [Cohnella sp. REN36]|uniref:LysR family transcriptional regulator n=1 Tax=Cohnella sp. REN36 TaxID=2887347 RepID=UPI001D13E34F|nr:LysR family transcriptional regulator [Cohnella sp. REN36]MCC3372765.1 LysR family transcriptional regulator [Cohnella sp. REN36]